jgi:putative DNA primase/helicase
MADYIFKTFRDTGEVLFYDSGVYKMNGESLIREQVNLRLNGDYTYIDRNEFNREKMILNLENGLFYIKSGELKPHTPEYLSTIKLALTYDPQAKCPNIDKFLKQIMESKDIETIQELIGYSLIPDYSIQKAFLFLGEGSNGKSTLIQVMESFVGKSNCSSESLQSLEQQRFASAGLYGKLLNTYADIPTKPVEHMTMFKMLTGGDTISAEQKFKNRFSFNNVARLIFSCNRPPIISGEDSFAFWRRWILINFPYKFTGDKDDKHLIEKLTTKQELSGLLNFAIEGLQRLFKTNEFTYSLTVDDVADIYKRRADPIYAFIKDRCEIDPTAWISTSDLYADYKQYCIDNKIPPVKPNVFGKELRAEEEIGIRPQRQTMENGDEISGYQGLRLQAKQVKSGARGANSDFKSNSEQDKLKLGNSPACPTNHEEESSQEGITNSNEPMI